MAKALGEIALERKLLNTFGNTNCQGAIKSTSIKDDLVNLGMFF